LAQQWQETEYLGSSTR